MANHDGRANPITEKVMKVRQAGQYLSKCSSPEVSHRLENVGGLLLDSSIPPMPLRTFPHFHKSWNSKCGKSRDFTGGICEAEILNKRNMPSWLYLVPKKSKMDYITSYFFCLWFWWSTTFGVLSGHLPPAIYCGDAPFLVCDLYWELKGRSKGVLKLKKGEEVGFLRVLWSVPLFLTIISLIICQGYVYTHVYTF